MLVVSDTSPLNYLVLVGHDGVLPKLFGSVLTAPAVIAELRHAGSPQRVQAWAAAPPSWLEVRQPTAIHPSLRLGRGENEAISLAHELRADAVLIDERKGARAAGALGLFVTGTLGVVVLAAEKGLLDLPAAIDALRATPFRASPELYERILSAHRGRRGAG